MQGHLKVVNTVIVTNDTNYIISGSADKTIIIWNLLKKKKETVLQGHLNEVNSLAVTSDNKYIISGSADKTVKIWNFLEKKEKAFLNFETSITSLDVDTDYNLTIYFDIGEKKTVNIKELI